jgi:dihydrofolate synthase/folylpolyglutamate synthase
LDLGLVAEAFAHATSPGRCEIVSRNPTIIIDAAHNPHGAISLRQTLESEFTFSKVISIFAPMSDKDITGLIREIEPIVDHLIISRNSSSRSADIASVKSLATSSFSIGEIDSTENLEEALKLAKSIAQEVRDAGSVAILVTGSVVTAGEMRQIVRNVEDQPK